MDRQQQAARPAKIRVTISVDKDTADRLKTIAMLEHTNVSQWITDMAWRYRMPEMDDYTSDGDYTSQAECIII